MPLDNLSIQNSSCEKVQRVIMQCIDIHISSTCYTSKQTNLKRLKILKKWEKKEKGKECASQFAYAFEDHKGQCMKSSPLKIYKCLVSAQCRTMVWQFGKALSISQSFLYSLICSFITNSSSYFFVILFDTPLLCTKFYKYTKYQNVFFYKWFLK